MFYKIPIRFQREIILHILKNTQENLLVDGTPSILGIFGPPGEGKTVMCKQILEDLGAHIEVMSVVEFESEDAGKPAERLKEKYYNALNHLNISKNSISALIIDDADTAFGKWAGDVQYTVNTQIIVGELMQLATNEKERKVPIILTGNDFSKIYYPLRRSGRMTKFYWEPNSQERLDSVEMLFDWLSTDDCMLTISSIESFASEIGLVKPPMSFYSSIKSILFNDDLWNDIYEMRQRFDGLCYLSMLKLSDYKDYSCDDIVALSKKELLSMKESNQDYSGGEKM